MVHKVTSDIPLSFRYDVFSPKFLLINEQKNLLLILALEFYSLQYPSTRALLLKETNIA